MTDPQSLADPTDLANPVDSIPITVLFFSFAAERVGMHRLERTVPRTTTVARLFAEYADQLGAGADRFLFSVNEAWAPATRELHPGDVVAIIPPVAGG
ncbi:MAG: MoaD/ThiS family protein [Thermaerobacter sp.]|nr:MoaD/ThiS family protein [Thermaerobacter sp.]